MAEKSFLKKLSEYNYPNIGSVKTTDVKRLIAENVEIGRFFKWFVENTNAKENFVPEGLSQLRQIASVESEELDEDSDTDDSCSELERELSNLTDQCEKIEKLKAAFDNHLSDVRQQRIGEDISTFSSSARLVESRWLNTVIQVSKFLNDFSRTIQTLETSINLLEETLCSDVSGVLYQRVKYVQDFDKCSVEDRSPSEKEEYDRNVDDLEKIRFCFEKLQKREMQLKLRRVELGAQVKRLEEIEKNRLVPEGETWLLRKLGQELEEELKTSESKVKHFNDVTLNTVASRFADQKISSVFRSDCENMQIWFDMETEKQQKTDEDLKVKHLQILDFKTKIAHLWDFTEQLLGSVSTIEKNIARFECLFEKTKRAFGSVERAVDLDDDTKTVSPETNLDVALNDEAKNALQQLTDLHSEQAFVFGLQFRNMLADLELKLNDAITRLDEVVNQVSVFVTVARR